MQFINMAMLFGLLAVAVPIIIHIFSHRNPKRIRWGAWLFLDLTMQRRKRTVLLEDILLLACRCLACGLLALAFARPFVRPDSPVPWAVTLPLLLLAITAIGISFAFWRYPKARFSMLAGGTLLLLLTLATVLFERQLNLRRFGLGATKDVVLLIDGSTSMAITHDGKTNFERAVDEARKYVESAPRNTAFSVIVGGPVPQIVNPVPVSDRRLVFSTLDDIRPANGTMAVAGNLTAAAMTLAAGQNAVKQIVIVGDGQSAGWQLTDVERWKAVPRIFSTLKTEPIITWRTLPLPTSVRNLALASIRPSRDIVGADREVGLDVTVVNAGTEAVTPKSVTLTVEGERLEAKELHQLEPGESQTFSFPHRFRQPGGTLLSAKVEPEDDLPNDDTCDFALSVVPSVKVLLVDGDVTASFLDRASTYVSLALRPELVKAAEAQDASAQRNYLLETKIEDAVTAGRRTSFAGFSAVVLVGVRRLSDESRAALAQFVSTGGGLFVMPGAGFDADFFNGWEFGGEKVLPAPYGVRRKNESALDPARFGEPLARFRSGTDLGAVRPESLMTFDDNWTSNAFVVARLADGSPFLLSRPLGGGTVMASAAVFDAASGLVSKRGFVPFVHELVYSLARPTAVSLDVKPAEELTLLLSSGAADTVVDDPRMRGYGLLASYYPTVDYQGKPFVRLDKSINFNWCGQRPPFGKEVCPGFPSDNYSVVWRGIIQPPEPGAYKLNAELPDAFSVKIGGKRITRDSTVIFEKDRSYVFEGRFFKKNGRAIVKLVAVEGSGKSYVVPETWFRPSAAGSLGAGEAVEIVDPHGERLTGEIYQSDDGLRLGLSRSVVPGVYRVASVPESLRQVCAGVLDAEGRIPISVATDVAESTLTAVTPNELVELGKYVHITQATKEEDVVKAIGGEGFGKEVWHLLALVAFLFLVTEPAIARWIAKNRRTGDVIDTEGAWTRM